MPHRRTVARRNAARRRCAEMERTWASTRSPIAIAPKATKSGTARFRGRSRGRFCAGPGAPGSSLLRDELLVLRRGEQLGDLLWRGELHLDHPALLVRVVVDPLRSVDELLVHLGDLARDRREQLAHRLGALHHAERL